jgi:hypothetical protein
MMFEDDYPKKDMLDSAESMNKDGGGFAWIDQAKSIVRWEKGMHVTSKFIMETIERENIQLPIVVHFRIATHGGVNNELCHPFAISAENSEDLDSAGYDTEGVLFHNGIWSDWNSVAMKVLLNDKETKLPDGGFSDSRIMAWLIRHLGTNYLALIDEKVSVLTPQGIKRFGKGWSTEEKAQCSNTHWKHSPRSWGSNNTHGTTVVSSGNNVTTYLRGGGGRQDFRGCVQTQITDTSQNDKSSETKRKQTEKEGEEITLTKDTLDDTNTFAGSPEDYEAIYNAKYSYEDFLAKNKGFGNEGGTGFIGDDGQWHEWAEDFLGDGFD